MSKEKSRYACSACGAIVHQWQGKCPKCSSWGTLEPVEISSESSRQKYIRSREKPEPGLLEDLPVEGDFCFSSGSEAVDNLLGSGLVPGSAILFAGEPGIGKSTFLLQLMGGIKKTGKNCIYVSGEESLAQLKLRAERLKLLGLGVKALSTTTLEDVLGFLYSEEEVDVLFVDSIQTMASEEAEGTAGSVSQVKASASALLKAAKAKGAALVLVGHVTKEGSIAGPKLLEHMVDTVLNLEGDKQHFFRILRVIKNRYGPTDRILVLQMEEKGLHIVNDPATFFLRARDVALSGSALLMAFEGQRSFAVEVQALASRTFFSVPRRTALGFDANRLNLILAIIQKKLGLQLGQFDIYAKIGAGLKLQEPGLDLALAAAILSSFYDRPLPEKSIFWGEVDLNGQVRPVMGAKQRLGQARQLGYSPIVCPNLNSNSSAEKGKVSGLLNISNLSSLPEDLF